MSNFETLMRKKPLKQVLQYQNVISNFRKHKKTKKQKIQAIKNQANFITLMKNSDNEMSGRKERMQSVIDVDILNQFKTHEIADIYQALKLPKTRSKSSFLSGIRNAHRTLRQYELISYKTPAKNVVQQENGGDGDIDINFDGELEDFEDDELGNEFESDMKEQQDPTTEITTKNINTIDITMETDSDNNENENENEQLTELENFARTGLQTYNGFGRANLSTGDKQIFDKINDMDAKYRFLVNRDKTVITRNAFERKNLTPIEQQVYDAKSNNFQKLVYLLQTEKQVAKISGRVWLKGNPTQILYDNDGKPYVLENFFNDGQKIYFKHDKKYRIRYVVDDARFYITDVQKDGKEFFHRYNGQVHQYGEFAKHPFSEQLNNVHNIPKVDKSKITFTKNKKNDKNDKNDENDENESDETNGKKRSKRKRKKTDKPFDPSEAKKQDKKKQEEARQKKWNDRIEQAKVEEIPFQELGMVELKSTYTDEHGHKADHWKMPEEIGCWRKDEDGNDLLIVWDNDRQKPRYKMPIYDDESQSHSDND